MIHIKTAEEFKKEVLESQVPVVVDFWASWCQPCQMLGPVIEELSTDYEGRAKIVKINIEEAQELAQTHQIMSIPTIIFFKGGQIKDRSLGYVDKELLAEKLDALL